MQRVFWCNSDWTAMRNTKYDEMGMGMSILVKGEYRDGYDAADANGCVDVPEGTGLGVECDRAS